MPRLVWVISNDLSYRGYNLTALGSLRQQAHSVHFQEIFRELLI